MRSRGAARGVGPTETLEVTSDGVYGNLAFQTHFLKTNGDADIDEFYLEDGRYNGERHIIAVTLHYDPEDDLYIYVTGEGDYIYWPFGIEVGAAVTIEWEEASGKWQIISGNLEPEWGSELG